MRTGRNAIWNLCRGLSGNHGELGIRSVSHVSYPRADGELGRVGENYATGCFFSWDQGKGNFVEAGAEISNDKS